MIKLKVTKNDLKYNDVIMLGYCEVQHLLHYKTANYYNAGVYGWNCDIYDLEDVLICTGYRPFGNIKPNFQTVKKYENKASKIVNNWNFKYEQKNKKLDYLIKKFIEEVMINVK